MLCCAGVFDAVIFVLTQACASNGKPLLPGGSWCAMQCKRVECLLDGAAKSFCHKPIRNFAFVVNLWQPKVSLSHHAVEYCA